MSIIFNSTTPAAPAGGENITWQTDMSGNVSGYVSGAGVLPVADGGTGQSTLPAHEILVGEGTSPVASIGNATAGYLLTSNGPGADPTFQPAPVPPPSQYNVAFYVDSQIMSDDYWLAVDTNPPGWAYPKTVM